MLEIFAVPYLGVSAVIGWVVFEPFFRDGATEGPSAARVTITDLMAVTSTLGTSFAFIGWAMPEGIRSGSVQFAVIAVASLFATATFAMGLHLVPRASASSFLRRLTVVGVIAPFGASLTLGWIVLLMWAGWHSVLYLIPAAVAVAAMGGGLRALSIWVCRGPRQTPGGRVLRTRPFVARAGTERSGPRGAA